MNLALHPIELVAAGLCVLLGATFLHESVAPLPAFNPPALILPRRSVTPEVISFVPPSEASLSVIDARPAFNPARTPIVASPMPGSGPSAAPPPIDFELVGVIVDSKTQLALLKGEGAPFATSLGVGATIGGWQVSEITLDSVVLRAGTAEQVLRLDSKRQAQPSQPPGTTQTSNPTSTASKIYSMPPRLQNVPIDGRSSGPNENP